MRSRRAGHDDVAEVTRRRLELLSAELAGLRGSVDSPASVPDVRQASAVTVPEPVDRATRSTSTSSRGRHARRSLGRVSLVGGWVHDRLPPTLQGRVGLSPSHLSVVALLVAVAFAVSAWWVVRAGGDGTIVPSSVTMTQSAPAGGATATPPTSPGASPSALVAGAPDAARTVAPASDSLVVVDVAGKVRRPGIATLPLGSRVVDALRAAGGARRGVDLTPLNLARLLVDGEQIVVGVPPPGGVSAPAASSPQAAGGSAGPGLVNINAAQQSDLEELPGIGPVTAAAILQWRTEHGPFTAVDELLEVSGIGDATLAEIAPFVTL